MTTEKKQKTDREKVQKSSVNCTDKLCPFHRKNAVKLRGRTFEGRVVAKLHGRVAIEFERILEIRKYERYEKRKTKLHARLPDCLSDKIQVGDLIKIAECRPLSKIIHFIVVEKIKDKAEK